MLNAGGVNMIASYEIFLLVAEELSISKAAARAHVTQQCVSDHIKRLEREFGVALFERHPRFALTDAGVSVLHYLRHIKILETSMKSSINEISKGAAGKLTIGINSTRARILLPGVLPLYREAFPNVILTFIMDDTRRLEEKLLAGKIDMFLGANASANDQFESKLLGIDHTYLVISENMLQKHGKIKASSSGAANAADIKDFVDLPFVANDDQCTLNDIIVDYLNKYNISLKSLYYTSDYDTQIALCAADLAVAILPSMIIKGVIDRNQHLTHNKLLALPVDLDNRKLYISLINHKDVNQPLFAREFIRLLKEQIEKVITPIDRNNFLA